MYVKLGDYNRQKTSRFAVTETWQHINITIKKQTNDYKDPTCLLPGLVGFLKESL